MKKTNFLFAIVAVASLSFAAPAFAGGISVDVHTHADHIGQLALSGADASNSATANATNIASLGSLDGAWTSDVDMKSTVDHAIQLGAAVAISDFGTGYGTANATVDNIAGLVSATLNNVTGNADIDTVAEADHVVQAGLSVALAGVNATAGVNNLAAVDTVKVNVGN